MRISAFSAFQRWSVDVNLRFTRLGKIDDARERMHMFRPFARSRPAALLEQFLRMHMLLRE